MKKGLLFAGRSGAVMVSVGFLMLGGIRNGWSDSFVVGGVETLSQPAPAPLPTTPPSRIYIQDFELDSEALPPPKPQTPSSTPHLLLTPKSYHPKVTPAERAARLVDLMSQALVKAFTVDGLPAERLAPQAIPEGDYWVVRGIFTDVDANGQAQRAVMKLGRSTAPMEIQVMVSDAQHSPSAPFVLFGTVKDPLRLPGAALTLCPYVSPARFTLEKTAAENRVWETAWKIAEEVRRYRDRIAAQGKKP